MIVAPADNARNDFNESVEVFFSKMHEHSCISSLEEKFGTWRY